MTEKPTQSPRESTDVFLSVLLPVVGFAFVPTGSLCLWAPSLGNARGEGHGSYC